MLALHPPRADPPGNSVAALQTDRCSSGHTGLGGQKPGCVSCGGSGPNSGMRVLRARGAEGPRPRTGFRTNGSQAGNLLRPSWGQRRQNASRHRLVYVLPELLLSPFGVGILLPTFDPEVPDLAMAGPFPAGHTDTQNTGTVSGGTRHEQSARPRCRHGGPSVCGGPG